MGEETQETPGKTCPREIFSGKIETKIGKRLSNRSRQRIEPQIENEFSCGGQDGRKANDNEDVSEELECPDREDCGRQGTARGAHGMEIET